MTRTLASLAAVLGAAVLVVVAADVLRWERQLEGDDRRFAVAPASSGLWSPPVAVPGDAAARLVGVRDDVAYRRALRRFWPVRPGQVLVSPELEAQRGQVEAELARVSSASEGKRRAHALNLLGLFVVHRYHSGGFGSGTAPTDPAERQATLRQAIGLFQSAIEADPATRDAKRNLELLLRDPGAQEFLVDTPSGQAAEGQGTGAGRGGTGY
ncbi:MAG TPA: hypothetical protein VM290_03365 [Gaiellaceae bacterium]|nr:hypothetical protein [Gaiellaceae bacterium]